MLGLLRMRMLELSKSLCNIFWHIEIDGLIWIVPIEVYATENVAIFVNGGIIMFLKSVDEMFCMSVANEFNAKVINNEIEYGGTSDMSEKARCVASWMVAVICEMFDEFNVRETSRLWEAIHSGADLDEYAVFVDEFFKIVLFHYVRWDCPCGDPEVFVPLAGICEGSD